MNGPGDLTLTHSSGTPDPKNCSLVSIIPLVGMSSCRGRAEAFARRLSSKLRTLGSQGDDADIEQEDEAIINGDNINTWMAGGSGGEQTVTDLQPLRHESDSFFDFDCEIDSPGSPVDECEYLRLIESSSNTPHLTSAAESGYGCASAASSHCSLEGPYFDVNSESEACTSHLQQQTTERLCETHESSKDEVDRGCTLITTKADSCNGSPTHNDSTLPLPSEGPDIKLKMENCLLAEEISLSQSVQDEILKELHQQSQVCKKEDDNNKRNLEDQQIKTEAEVKNEEFKQQTQQIVNIINGHAQNGEDFIKIEVLEVPIGKEVVEFNIEEGSKSSNDVVTGIIQDTQEAKICGTGSDQAKISHLHMEATDDEDDRPQRVRRCSSLKTGKTPPGTPGRKKIVRFADVLGLDLADIKTFLDEIPNIPKSAYEDLEVVDNEPPVQLGPKSDKLLMPLFQQPGGLPNFLDIVREKLVSLENAAVTDAINQTITGSVRVVNLDFHKSVHIRYSLDGWRSFADLQANYVQNSCDGFSDKFTFVVFGNSLHIGQRLEFAVRFQCKGQQYWDNNYGANYCFQCLPSVAPIHNNFTSILPSHHSNNMAALLSPTVGDTWCTSFY